MKKNFLYILLFIFTFTSLTITVNAEGNSAFNCETAYSEESDYKLYQYRVNCICNQYLYKKKGDIDSGKYKSVAIQKELKKYLEIKKGTAYKFNEIQNDHRLNMNTIYQCALLNVKRKSYFLIKNDLINKSASLGKKLSSKLDNKLSDFEHTMKKLKCNQLKDRSSIQKLIVLNQATYQTCKYSSYIEYLKDHNRIIRNNVEEDNYYVGDIANIENQKKAELDKELKHIYKIFPIVFQAYTEYENNISIHILLELIKTDYLTLKQKLHKSLSPINQVVYKISNAMKK